MKDKEFKQRLAKIEAEFDQLKKDMNEPELIPVPDCIKFEKSDGLMELISEDGEMSLSTSVIRGKRLPCFVYAGGMKSKDTYLTDKKAYLQKCKRSDLKGGDFAFRSSVKVLDFESNIKYCVLLDDEKYSYIYRNISCNTCSDKWKHWYKVVFK